MDRRNAAAAAARLTENVEKVIKGNRRAVEAAATALFAGGHLLIEDVPGVGKTMLARSLAASVSGSFKRIQGTPDLLPSDITGTTVFDQQTHHFDFIPGPVFANVVLVDEVNRATPRAQAALLEAMDEKAVTVDGVRHPLPSPLFVVATQNPLEQHGTFPLPEGQLDRFALSIDMGYVAPATEKEIIVAQLHGHPIEQLGAVLSPDDVMGVQRAVRETFVSQPVLDFALAIVTATRKHPEVALGASPRASVTLIRCAQARALLKGREFVVPDDVKALALGTLSHRIVTSGGFGQDAARGRKVMQSILDSTPAPVTDGGHAPPPSSAPSGPSAPAGPPAAPPA
ncbi:MAG TPA: MoxR family ATPase, partial [Actinomycetota bacterium]|nr:MoxR family ATPase [Actinomycetota bacterium]